MQSAFCIPGFRSTRVGGRTNDGRSFAEYALHFSTFLQENLSVLGSVADLFWESDHNSLHGRAVGIGVRYFPFKQHWLDLLVRDVQPRQRFFLYGGARGMAWRLFDGFPADERILYYGL